MRIVRNLGPLIPYVIVSLHLSFNHSTNYFLPLSLSLSPPSLPLFVLALNVNTERAIAAVESGRNKTRDSKKVVVFNKH